MTLLALALAGAPLAAAEERPETRVLAQADAGDPEPGAGDDASAADDAAKAAPPSGVEVIRIKGRGVTAIDSDVPQSVTQFDAAAIEALGAKNVQDLAKVTPNVEIRTANATTPTFFIRGVGLNDFTSNASGSVAIYQDDVAINAPAIQLGLLYDIENVEVLRGPQGTGDNRNASAGAIKIYSRKPVGDYSARLKVSLGTYWSDLTRNGRLSDWDGLRQDYEGAIEAPLVDEWLSTRLAFRFTAADPYATNGCGGVTVPLDPPDGRLPAPDSDGRWTRFDRDGPAFCGEGLTGNVPNPNSVNWPNGNPPPPPPGAENRAREVRFLNISEIQPGLPVALNDAGDWAARGMLRLQPPSLEMDWLLTLRGERLSQLSNIGQAMGTDPRLGGSAGARVGFNYREPDQQEMFEPTASIPAGPERDAARDAVSDVIAEKLDIRPYRADVDRVGMTTRDSWGASLRGDWNLDASNVTTLKLVSISGYDWYDRFRDIDTDFTPDTLFESVTEDGAWQFFQDLKLRGELADTPLRWEVGGLFLMEKLDQESLTEIASVGDVERRFDQGVWSANGWVQASWDFLDDFTLEGGVRWNWERRDIDLEFTRNSIVKCGENSQTWSAPTGTLLLRYRFSEDVSAYWKYNRGWKSGSYNGNATDSFSLEEGQCAIGQPPLQIPYAEPEVIDAFEFGLRGSWAEGRLAAGGALFYYGYDNYQVFRVASRFGADPAIEVVNADSAEIYGGELDFRAEPLAGWAPGWLDGLVINGRFGWLEGQFLDFTDTISAQLQNGVTRVRRIDLGGNQLINSPRFKASMSVDWTFDLGRWGSLIPRYDFAWSDEIFFGTNEGQGFPDVETGEASLPEYTIGQPAYWLHNARLTYRAPTGNVELSFWVRNFTDEVYRNFAFDVSAFQDVVIAFPGQPRTAGIDFNVTF